MTALSDAIDTARSLLAGRLDRGDLRADDLDAVAKALVNLHDAREAVLENAPAAVKLAAEISVLQRAVTHGEGIILAKAVLAMRQDGPRAFVWEDVFVGHCLDRACGWQGDIEILGPNAIDKCPHCGGNFSTALRRFVPVPPAPHDLEAEDPAWNDLVGRLALPFPLPADAVRGIWSELEECRRGKNGYGGTVTEIYAYRLIPEGTASTQPSVGPRAAANLTAILRAFATRYGCKIGLVESRDNDRVLDLPNEEVPPFDWRIHIRVIPEATEDAELDHDAMRRDLRAAARAHNHAAIAGLAAEATLLLVDAVDRLTDTVDKHGHKVAVAVDYISDHLPGDR